MRVRLERFDFTAPFRGELAAAPEDVRTALKDVLRRARENPEAGGREVTPEVTRETINARDAAVDLRVDVIASHVSPELADLQRLSVRDVAALIGRGEQSIRDMVKAGKFPPADHRDGPRCVRWSAGLVRRWLESTSATTTTGAR